VQNRFGGDQLEFKVSRIELMDEIREKYFKSITVKIPLSAVTGEVISELEKLTANKKGKSLLRFDIYDLETNMMVNLFSRNTRIEITDELLAFIENQEDLAFKIN
jgi:DNA polymerase-3 subunit alpha